MKPLISSLLLLAMYVPQISHATESVDSFFCKPAYEKRIRRAERLVNLKFLAAATGAGVGVYLTSRIPTYDGTTGQSLSPAQGGEWTPVHLLVGALLAPAGAAAGYEITSETLNRRPKLLRLTQAYAFLKVITEPSESDSSTEKYLDLIPEETRVRLCGAKSNEASECWSLIRAQVLKVSQTDRFCSDQLWTLSQITENLD